MYLVFLFPFSGNVPKRDVELSRKKETIYIRQNNNIRQNNLLSKILLYIRVLE